MCGTLAIPSSLVSPLYFLQSVKTSAHWSDAGRIVRWRGHRKVETAMADVPANNQAAVQTERCERSAQQLARLGASPAALRLTSGPGHQGRN